MSEHHKPSCSYLNLPMKTELSRNLCLSLVYDIGLHMVLALLPVISIVDHFCNPISVVKIRVNIRLEEDKREEV